MNIKIGAIIVAVILIAAVVLSSGGHYIEEYFGNEDVEGTIVVDLYGITPSGERISLTGSFLNSIIYNGNVITYVEADVTLLATTTIPTIDSVLIDATNTHFEWTFVLVDLAPGGAGATNVDFAPTSYSIKLT